MPVSLLVILVLVFISVSGSLANGLVFVIFHRKPALRTLSNRFVLSLVFANLVSTVALIPGHIYAIVRSSTPTAWSDILQGLTTFISLASTLSTVLISLDRYFAVSSPLHYSAIVTRRKSLVMIASVWTASLLFSIPAWLAIFTSSFAGSKQLDWLYRTLLFLCGFLGPLSALCWLYFRMYEAALRNNARTRRQSLSSNTEHMTPHKGPAELFLNETEPKLATNSRNCGLCTYFRLPSRLLVSAGRPLRTSTMIVLSFIACWFPTYLSYLVEFDSTSLCAARIASFASVLASPAIYVYRNKIARDLAKRLLANYFCPCYRQKTANVSITLRYSSTYCRTNSQVAFSRRTSMISSNFESVRKGSNESHLLENVLLVKPRAASQQLSVIRLQLDGTVSCQLAENKPSLRRTASLTNVQSSPEKQLHLSKSSSNIQNLT